MSLSSGFFNSKDHDRVYNADQFSRIFDGIINDGVYSAVGDRFKVSPMDGLNLSVGSGRAWFDGTWTYNDSDIVLTLDEPHQILNRYDVIVLQIDKTDAVRNNTIVVIKGQDATNPIKPTLVKSENFKQYPLAYVFVGAKVTTIATASIQIVVGTNECPYVTGPLQLVSASDLYRNWEAEFNTWYEGLKNIISEDEAYRLQNEIDSVSRILDSVEKSVETKTIVIPVEAWTGTDLFTATIENDIFKSYGNKPIISCGSPETKTKESYTALKTAWNYICDHSIAEGSITFTAINKPTVPIVVDVNIT